jgi:hypothetical protein
MPTSQSRCWRASACELQRPLRAKGKALSLSLGAGALLLLAGDLYLQLGSHNSTIEAAAWSEQPQSLDALAGEEPGAVPASRLLSFDPQQEVFLAGYLRSQGWSAGHAPYEAARNLARDNYNVLFGVPQAEFYLPLYPQRARAVTESMYLSSAQTGRTDRLHDRLAALFNVGHVLASERGAPVGMEAIAEFPGRQEPAVERIRLHRLAGVLPRAFLVGSARVVTGAGHERGLLPAEQMEALLAVTDPAFEPRDQLVIDRAAGEDLPDLGLAPRAVDGRVEVVLYEAERVRLNVDSPRDAWLFLSDTWYPGWQAWVDGEPATLYPANVAGRAVRIAAGQHAVELRFRSRALGTGVALALVAMLGLLVFVVRSRPGIP